MKISKLTKHLVLAFVLGACSSDDPSSAEGGDEAVETSEEGMGDEAALGEDELLEEVTGESSSEDMDSLEMEGEGTETADAGDGMDGELDSMEEGTEEAPAEVAAAEAPADEAPVEAPAEETEIASEPPAARASASYSGDAKMVVFFEGSETGANVAGMDWQAGYGDNPIKFPCAFNKRSPLKAGEDRFGCVITENGANTIAHVHEGRNDAQAPVLTKVTIDKQGADAQARWEQNLKDAGYLYHKDTTWRAGLTAKKFMSGDHKTHVYLVWNGPEEFATLIFMGTAKGVGKEITPVAANGQ